jgi:enoyl-CoA hydratase
MTPPDYGRYETLRFDRDGAILTITLDPGTPLNAITGPLHTELSQVWADVRLDPATDVVVLTGGERTFSAGADLEWLRAQPREDPDALFAEGRRIVIDMLEVPQPIVAAIEGPAIGFGATLAMLCDVKFAAENAQIGDPHVLVGLVSGDGGAVLWPWLIGVGRAKRYLMTGDLISGAEAERIGLVEEVVAAGEANAAAVRFARRLERGHRRAIRGSKASVNKLLRDSANQILDTSLALEKECMMSGGYDEAITALQERLTKARA